MIACASPAATVPAAGANESHDAGAAFVFQWEDSSPIEPGAPARFALAPQPNPARGHTTFVFDLPESLRVRLAVYDVVGREVAVLVDGYQSAGHHEVRWDAAEHPSGVYLCRLTAGPHRVARTLSLVR